MSSSTSPFGEYEANKDREFVDAFERHLADEAGKFAYHAGQSAYHANQMAHFAKLINYKDAKTVGEAAFVMGQIAFGAGQTARVMQEDRAVEKRIADIAIAND